MAEDDDRPFVCSEPNCTMRFANEDHLSVHRMKHEMSLSLHPGGGTKSSNLLFVDQTPTPTKFLRNCEEIGLFSDLSKNPFEEAFKKAADTVHDPKADVNLPGPESVESTPALPPPPPPPPQHILPHLPKISPLARVEPTVPLIVVSQQNEDPSPLEGEAPPLPGPSADTHSTISTQVKSPLPPKKALLAKQVKEEEAKVKETSLQQSILLPSPTSAEAKSNQYVLQVLVQMPGGELVPVQIPASVAPSTSPATVTTTTSTAVSMTPTAGLASVATKQKLKAAIQQNASTSAIRPPEVKVMDVKAPTIPMLASPPVAIKIERPLSSQLSILSSDSENSMGFNCDDSECASPNKRMRTESMESDCDNPDDRRKKFLERNRAAAARCRQKKKQWIGNLENKADDLQTLNVRLQNEVTILKSEVAQLKGLLLAHKDCPITLQQQRQQQQQQQQNNTRHAMSLAQSSSLETQSDSISSTSQNAQMLALETLPSPASCVSETSASSLAVAMATRSLATNQTFTIINVPSVENS